jgi:hypothetical protein
MGTLTQTDSGLIQQESTWASCPAWLTEVQDTPGRITYADGVCSVYTSDPSQFAYLRTAALGKNSPCVCRTKFYTSAMNGIYMAHLLTLATPPTGSVTLADDVIRSVFYSGTASPYIRGADDAYDATDFSVVQDSTGVFLYEWEIGQPCRYTLRNASTGAAIATGSYANDLTYDPCWAIGDVFAAYHNGGWGISLMQMVKGLTATVIGLSAGNYVTVTDPSGTVLGFATAVDTSVAIDISTLQYPYSGKVLVYDTEGGELEDTFTGDLWGGWIGEYEGAVPPVVISVAPDTGPDNADLGIEITGTAFIAGATVDLEKAGQTGSPAAGVSVDSATSITCTLELAGLALGDWDLTVTNPDTLTDTLPAAITVTDGGTDPTPWIGTETYRARSGRMITEDGRVINVADLLTGTSATISTGHSPGTPRSGRMLKEDNTTVNIADTLGG